jgi:hypothetical protein
MSDNTKPWTPQQLAALNAAWFDGRALRTCDEVSGGRCIALRAKHRNQFAPLDRIVWGWLGGSDANGVLWDVTNATPRAQRDRLPWTEQELVALKTIKVNRVKLSPAKAAHLTDDYIRHLLNRTDIDPPTSTRPSLGML